MKRLALVLAITGLAFVGCMSLHTDSQAATNPTTMAAEECVTFEVRFVTATQADVAKFGLSKDITLLTLPKVSALLRQTEAGRHSSIIHAPRVTIYYGENCHVADYTRLRYVSDYETQKTSDNPVGIVTPVWDTLDEGISAMLRADPADGGMIDVTAYVNWQLLHGWKDVPAPSNKVLTVHVPDVHQVEFLQHMNLHSQEMAACVIDSDPLLDKALNANLGKVPGISPDLAAKLAPTTKPTKDDPTELVLLIRASKCDGTDKSYAR